MESTLSRTGTVEAKERARSAKDKREESSPGRSLTLHKNNGREHQSQNQKATLTHLSFPRVEKKHFT